MTEYTAPGVGGKLSALDALRELATVDVTRPPCVLTVPERPGWKLRFDANIPNERRQAWIRANTNDRNEVDSLALALTALSEKHLAIIDPDGDEVTEDGTPLTFRDAQVQKMFGAASPLEAVRKFFGVDPHCDDAATKLYGAAGYYDEVTTDPTPGSSTSS